MFLRSLTLRGFKSFADPTTLEFEPGVTVVVGPNGSGKSNIVDAVAWVLGAQGPRTVRSSKMEDVIFAGTAGRPALGRAEVSLTIDNSAGLLPIDLSEVTITRTLFRSGDSEYAINGAPCRLLDVQELLSDSGVGRQQHVIVSQGQLDSVLNARPEDRRLIIEEAAGVLKYRRRRERAQRRLDSTEGNLTRLSDLLREVRRQLRPLEKQAEAARRHTEMADEVRALRVHVAGRELAALEGRMGAASTDRQRLAAEEQALRSRLAGLDTEVMVAERTMSASAADGGLADHLGRLESVRERARGLAAVMAERRRSIERDLAASRDEGVVASLESDAARITAQLGEVDGAAAGLLAEADRVAEAERTVTDARAAFAAQFGQPDADDAAGGDGEPTAAEVRAALEGRRTTLARDRAECERLSARRDSLSARRERAAEAADRAGADLAESETAGPSLEAAADSAARDLADAQAALEAADAHHREADRLRHSWRARAEALALALEEAAAQAGAKRLAGLDGVVGTLLDLVDVDPGWEAAFEAAAGEALAAVVVDGPEAARAAFGRLHEQGAKGALVVLGLDLPAPPPASGPQAVRSHVRSADPRVERLLDTILGSTTAVDGGWESALEAARHRPGLVAVNRDGDRFGPTGWRTGAAGTGATGAALEDARGREQSATSDVDAAAGELAAARDRLGAATRADQEARAVVEATRARAAAARDHLARLSVEQADLDGELASLAADLEELSGRLAAGAEALAGLEERLPALEAREAALAADAAARRDAQANVDRLAAAATALRSEMEVRAAGLEERRSLLQSQLAAVEERLRSHVAERAQAAARRTHLEASLTAVGRLARVVEADLEVLETALVEVRERRRVQAESTRAAASHLEGLRRDRSEAERGLERVREQAQRNSLEEAEVRLRMETLVESIRRDLDCEPEAARSAPCPELPEGASAAGRLRDLERELRLLGPINPLAMEEFTALQERHEFLEGQLEDVKASRRELAKVIRAIDSEIVEVFAAAYADVSQNFEHLFATLFPGGVGRLRLTDPDNLLETGIEIEGRPSGKNVKRLSLLSGGERSLTAIAYLFAVFRSRPSPFYLMDEVEAALDDVNLHRFLDLIHDFRDEAQLLIVSHQKRTMEAADCLYGVTMQPGGSSKVISERVSAGV